MDLPAANGRRHQRFEVSCRASIRIGRRQYAGYVENISQSGACIRTLSHIRDSGPVLILIPDLPPKSATLRWLEKDVAGVIFDEGLKELELGRWLKTRLYVAATRIAANDQIVTATVNRVGED